MGLQRWEPSTWGEAAFRALKNVLGRTPVFGSTKSVAAAYSIVDSDDLVLCDTTSAGFTVTLPLAATNLGRRFTVLKSDASGNTLTLDGNGSETINGSATKTTTTRYAGWVVQSDGANWWVIP